jgi:hypothetical protein
MSIDQNYNETVDVERLGYAGGSGSGQISGPGADFKEFSVYIIGLRCLIQAFDEKIAQDITYGFGKEHLMFCAVRDIQEGDRVIRTEKGKDVEYRVTAVKKLEQGQNPHLEIKIRVFKS